MAPYEQKVLPIMPSAPALRAVPVYPYPFAIPIIFLAGVIGEGDGLQGFCQWIASSMASDDNVNIFQPNWVPAGQAGRWVRLTSTLAAATSFNQRTITTNDSFGSTDFMLRCNAVSAPIVAILPAVATSINRAVAAKKVDSSVNTVTVSGDGTIDGRASWVINQQYETYSFQSNGTTWDVMP